MSSAHPPIDLLTGFTSRNRKEQPASATSRNPLSRGDDRWDAGLHLVYLLRDAHDPKFGWTCDRSKRRMAGHCWPARKPPATGTSSDTSPDRFERRRLVATSWA